MLVHKSRRLWAHHFTLYKHLRLSSISQSLFLAYRSQPLASLEEISGPIAPSKPLASLEEVNEPISPFLLYKISYSQPLASLYWQISLSSQPLALLEEISGRISPSKPFASLKEMNGRIFFLLYLIYYSQPLASLDRWISLFSQPLALFEKNLCISLMVVCLQYVCQSTSTSFLSHFRRQPITVEYFPKSWPLIGCDRKLDKTDVEVDMQIL